MQDKFGLVFSSIIIRDVLYDNLPIVKFGKENFLLSGPHPGLKI